MREGFSKDDIELVKEIFGMVSGTNKQEIDEMNYCKLSILDYINGFNNVDIRDIDIELLEGIINSCEYYEPGKAYFYNIFLDKIRNEYHLNY